jgi:lipopolysaccharide heptosyltransferase II
MTSREALVHRNQQMAQAFHQAPVKHLVRQQMIRMVGHIDFQPLKTRIDRTLIIKPDHIGDVLLATPAIRALKNALPLTEIHVLAGHWAADILGSYTEVDQVLTVPFPGFQRQATSSNPFAPYLQLVRVSRQLRAIGYQRAIIMRPDHWWGAMLAHVAGIRERIGYDLPDVAPFLTQALPLQEEHVILQGMRLVESFTGSMDAQDVTLTLPTDELSHAFVHKFLQDSQIPQSKQFICIHPGAGSRFKLWDAEKWAKVADTLMEQMSITVVFTGVEQERSIIAQIQNRMQHKAINAAGELNLRQLPALYAQAEAVLGPDSGPMHIASAVQTPTVALFGPADPIQFGTWGDNRQHIILTSNIACRPCRVLDWGDDDLANHPCVRDISVGDVLEATRRVISYHQEKHA